MSEPTHRVTIEYLQDRPPGKLVFELKDVPAGPDKLPEVLRSIARATERDELLDLIQGLSDRIARNHVEVSERLSFLENRQR